MSSSTISIWQFAMCRCFSFYSWYSTDGLILYPYIASVMG